MAIPAVEPRRQERAAYAQLILLALIWSVNWPLVKVILPSVSPITLLVVRFFGATALAGAIAAGLRQPARLPFLKRADGRLHWRPARRWLHRCVGLRHAGRRMAGHAQTPKEDCRQNRDGHGRQNPPHTQPGHSDRITKCRFTSIIRGA